MAKADLSPTRINEIKEAIAKDRGVTVEQLDKAAAGEKDEEEDNTIVSFFPRASAPSDKETGEMSSKDAADDAWQQVFGTQTEIAAAG